jgi:hypothetical protein
MALPITPDRIGQPAARRSQLSAQVSTINFAFFRAGNLDKRDNAKAGASAPQTGSKLPR